MEKKSFFGNLFGGDKDVEEKKEKELEEQLRKERMQRKIKND